MRIGNLNPWSDFEPEIAIKRKNATTGKSEAATGLTGIQFRISATKTGAAIGSLTANATERGTTGIYAAVFDTAALVTALISGATSYLGQYIYLIPSKSGDFDRHVSQWLVLDHTEM